MIPFCIVPCCVFHRLFPHRRKVVLVHSTTRCHDHEATSEHLEKVTPSNTVSTYADLLDYLQAKHPTIQRTELPFKGSNIILWSTF
jgi:hypothetical protein